VFEKNVLRKIVEPKGMELILGWRNLHNKLHNLYYWSNKIRIINSRKMQSAGHILERRGMIKGFHEKKNRRKEVTRKRPERFQEE
jgi:hypothetical protein